MCKIYKNFLTYDNFAFLMRVMMFIGYRITNGSVPVFSIEISNKCEGELD